MTSRSSFSGAPEPAICIASPRYEQSMQPGQSDWADSQYQVPTMTRGLVDRGSTIAASYSWLLEVLQTGPSHSYFRYARSSSEETTFVR
jgi:hypothetical protein